MDLMRRRELRGLAEWVLRIEDGEIRSQVTFSLSLPIRKKVEKYIRNTHIFENCVYTHTHFIRKVRVYTRVYTQKSSLRIYARTAYGQL